MNKCIELLCAINQDEMLPLKKSFFKTEGKVNTIIVFLSVLLVFSTAVCSQSNPENIQLNQEGFYPGAPKLAVVTNRFSPDTFYITSVNVKDTFFSGLLSEEKQSAYSSTKTRTADFTAFTRTGKYILVHAGNHSYPFEIKNNILHQPAVAVLKGYYYQRASMPLAEKYAGKWHRSGFHPDDKVYIHPSAATSERPAGTVISSPGGWYDAGDYNKYIVNSGISMGTIFEAYEDFPAYFNQLKTTIPESGDNVPDILHEAIYNLRWMLTMQDPTDGGVYHKCTNAAFDGMVMPGVTTEKRYVVQKGTAASLDFAAVTAQAGRILKKFQQQFPGLADSCITAGKKAWAWALLHPALEYNQDKMNQQFTPAITTGGYGDRNFKDEWLWAAAELFITTGEDRFYETVEAYVKETVSLPGWNNVAMMAYYSFLHYKDQLPAKCKPTLALMKERVIAMAETYLQKAKGNAFQTVMGQSVRDFNWGGNGNAANQGMLLMKAWLLTNEKKYVDGALTNADYLLGRNATGYCFISGEGSKPPMFLHHRQSVADGIAEPVPGLVAGGPNPGMQDKCHYPFTEPETAYLDAVCSYASNEIAINWNAPVVYLLNAIEAVQQKTGYSKQ